MNRPAETPESAADRALARFVPEDAPGCVLMLAKDGKTLLRRCRGLADMERGVPLSAEDNFIIASHTKQFACVAILMLRDRGLLDPDEPIARFFPDFPAYRERVTLRMLMTHTSGIREYFEDASPEETERLRTADAAEVLRLIRGFGETAFEPGTRWSYCNSGFVMLGDVVRQLTGKPFGAFLESEVFAPLGMTRSRAPDTTAQRDPRLAGGYEETAPGAFERQPWDMLQVGYADGNVSSNADDLLRWHRFLFQSGGEPLLRPGSLRELFAPCRLRSGTEAPYGLGFFLGTMDPARPSYSPRRREIFHTGRVPGFVSRVSYFPENGVSAILLSNRGSLPRDALLFAALDGLFR
jgi:CubicO group peptidase (beta-lactamase class C family)